MDEKTQNKDESLFKEHRSFIKEKLGNSLALILLSYLIAFVGRRAHTDILYWTAMVMSFVALVLEIINLPKVLKAAACDYILKVTTIIKAFLLLIMTLILFAGCLYLMGYIG